MKFTEKNRYYDARKEIKKLAARARRGNKSAFKELKSLAQSTFSEANKRMRILERRGRNYYAYDLARHYLDNARDKTIYAFEKGDTIQDIEKTAMSAAKFIQSESSTLQGQLRIERDRLKSIKERYGFKGNTSKLCEFMSTELFQQYVQFDSEATFMLAEEALYKQKLTMQDLDDAWEKFQAGEGDLTDVWRNWGDIEPFDF